MRQFLILVFCGILLQIFLFIYLQFFLHDWIEERSTGRKVQQEDYSYRSLIQLVLDKNASAASTEMKMVMKGEPFPSIVTTDSNGRLGNQLSAYAVLQYFQEVHGMYGVMGSWQINMLADVFGKENLKVTTFNVDVPPQFSLNWEMVASPSQSVWVLNSYFLDNMEEYRHNKFINIGLYPHYLFLYKNILDQLRDHLVFKPHVKDLVHNGFEKISSENKNEKEIIFVGVHCRLTDYGNHLKAISGASLVDHHYFDRAFDIYRARYNNDNTQVIFLVMSDDPQWIKKNLGKYEDVRFGINFREGMVTEMDMIAFDLCLLGSCNHSIITYGTFGTWGALFAGGDVIAPTGTNPEGKTEDDLIWEKAAMDGWLYLDVRDVNNIQEVTYIPPVPLTNSSTRRVQKYA